MSVAGPLGPGFQLLAPKTFGRFDATDWAIAQIPAAGSAYGAYRSFDSGNYASGAVGSIATVYEAFAIYESYDADIQSRSTGPPAPGHPWSTPTNPAQAEEAAYFPRPGSWAGGAICPGAEGCNLGTLPLN